MSRRPYASAGSRINDTADMFVLTRHEGKIALHKYMLATDSDNRTAMTVGPLQLVRGKVELFDSIGHARACVGRHMCLHVRDNNDHPSILETWC